MGNDLSLEELNKSLQLAAYDEFINSNPDYYELDENDLFHLMFNDKEILTMTDFQYSINLEHLIKEVPNLKIQTKELIEKRDYSNLNNKLKSRLKELLHLLEKTIPKEAERELRIKHSDYGRGGFYSDGMLNDTKYDFRKKRWGFELEILRAEKEEEINRLFHESKDALEKRYSRKFNSRADFAVMNAIFEDKSNLISVMDDLDYLSQKLNHYKKLNLNHPEMAWDKISDLFEKFYLIQTTNQISDCLVDFIKNISNPGRYFSERIKPLNCKPDIYDSDNSYFLLKPMLCSSSDSVLNFTEEYFISATSVFHEYKLNLSSFGKSLDILDYSLAKMAGFNIKSHTEVPFGADVHHYYRLPGVKETALKIVSKGYKEKSDSAKKLMKPFKELFLRRWKETEEDYRNIFRYHKINGYDDDLLFQLYSIRCGNTDFDSSIIKKEIPISFR